MKKIKILQMPIANSQGGLTQYVLQNWKFINKEKFQFDFVTLSKSLDFADELTSQGCKIHYISCTSSENEEQFIVEMKKVLEEEYDVIHLHTSYWNGILVEKLAKEYGCPKVIVHSHSTMVDIIDDEKRMEAIRVHNEYKKSFPLEYATHYCACSKPAAEWLYGEQIPKDKIVIFNNAIDTEHFTFSKEIREKYRKQLDLNGSFVLGHVGRFAYQKNHTMMLDIFKKVLDKVPNARLILVGNGPLEENIKRLAREHNIYDNILFLGMRHDVAELMQAMDVFLLPSLFEGLGFVLVEAQATGLKCLASDSLPRESKLTNHIRYLPNNVNEWVDEIVQCSKGYSRRNNEALIEELGYSIRNYVKKLEKIYEDN